MTNNACGRLEPPNGNLGLVLTVVGWSLAWKGVSLWHAARDNSKPWFVTLLVSNTLGVLDAVYIFGVRTRKSRVERDEAAIRASTGEPEQRGHSEET